MRPLLNGGTLGGRRALANQRLADIGESMATYFPDLSDYAQPGVTEAIPARNVGWLDGSHDFPVAPSAPDLLERLWEFCLVSVWPSRGLTHCPLCQKLGLAEQDGDRLILGTAEIRVFDPGGRSAYASPNLVYHYIDVHQYQPPDAFLEALSSGPRPTSHEYRQLLKQSGSQWVVSELNTGAFRFVKRNGEVVRETIVEPQPSGVRRPTSR